MTTGEFLLSGWNWDPFGTALCAITAIGFAVASRKGDCHKSLPYLLAGVAVLIVALVSPIGTLAKSYLFSAHMLQHLLLLLVVPPLLLLGMGAGNPGREKGGSTRQAWVKRAVSAPPLTWLAGVGAMWIWHMPVLCDATTTSNAVNRLQTVSLLVLGTLFWWPIIGLRTERRLPPLAGLVYLTSACAACTVLGIYLTFAPLNPCSVFRHPIDALGILPLIREHWGMKAEVDQQLGGLMMWVPACLIYLSSVLALLGRWYSLSDPEDAGPLASSGKVARSSPTMERN